MKVFGEEGCFFIKGKPMENNDSGFFLRYMGVDSTGIIFRGKFPGLWRQKNCRMNGPEIYDEENLYKVVRVDYHRNLIWLSSLKSTINDIKMIEKN